MVRWRLCQINIGTFQKIFKLTQDSRGNNQRKQERNLIYWFMTTKYDIYNWPFVLSRSQGHGVSWLALNERGAQHFFSFGLVFETLVLVSSSCHNHLIKELSKRQKAVLRSGRRKAKKEGTRAICVFFTHWQKCSQTVEAELESLRPISMV